MLFENPSTTPGICLQAGTSLFLNPIFNSDNVNLQLSHKWFGNLVTMKWWTDLWLKVKDQLHFLDTLFSSD
jgi:hypothetical protein